MRCSEVQGIIRNLGGGDRMAPDVIRHLEECAACSAALSEHRRTLAAIKALPWPVLDPWIAARLLQPELLRPSAGSDRAAHSSRAPDIDPPPPAAHLGAGHPTRRWRLVDGFAVGLILLAAGWLLSQRLATVPSAKPPPVSSPVAISSPTPHPVATRVGDGGRLTEFRGVASQPMALVIDSGWERGDDMKCRRVWIELGDGTEQELNCRADIPLDAYPAFPSDTTYTITHTYAAGNYFPQLRMVLEDGTELIQTAAQILVAPTAPLSVGQRLWRLRPLVGGLVFILAGLLWFGLRRAKDRWMGLVLAGALGTVVVAALVSLMLNGSPVPSMFDYLGALSGQTGLDPLDPAAPLADYTIESSGALGGYDYFVTRFTYADGKSRTYRIPYERHSSPKDGLGRLRTEHRALAGIPFADFERDGIALETPERLPAETEADRRPIAAQNWLQANCAAHGNLVLAPDDSAVLVAQTLIDGSAALWHVPLDGDPDRQVSETAYDYLWSPDGRFLVLVEPFAEAGHATRVVIQDSATGSEREVASVDALARPGVTAGGVWVGRPDGLWRMPFDGDTMERAMAWPSDPRFTPATHEAGRQEPQETSAGAAAALVRPSPDGNRVAYTCRAGLCLSNIDGSDLASVDVRVSDVTWSPDGEQIAVVEYSLWPRMLWLIDRGGTTRNKLAIAPEGAVSPPAWTLDSRRLFLTTCPLDGRRIITVDAADGEVRDLSQPRWDAWAALMPGENALLLSNGRGGYWRAGIRER